jgi:hypothetical protein
MIRKKEEQRGPIVIDTTGPNGNAFALLGTADRLARQLGYNEERRDDLRRMMMAGDYQNLLEVMDNEFGDLIILEV